MKKVLMSCIGSAVGVYELIGILGYLTFGSKVSSNLIADYAPSTFISLSRLAISILVLLSYPLQLHPCRASLQKVLSAYRSQDTSTGDSCERSEITRYALVTASLLLASFLIAINVQRLETVLGFVGSTGSTTISYILPSLFFLKLFPPPTSKSGTRVAASSEDDDEEENQEEDILLVLNVTPEDLGRLRLAAKVLLTVGFGVMGICLSMNIRDAIWGGGDTGPKA